MLEKTVPKILCVDDDQNVLDGLALHLRRKYNMMTAPSGQAGLTIIQQEKDFAVIMSDMRMPGMDGATFLALAKTIVPDATRVLLTGQADLPSTVAAVNDGQIFRFLTKPCPPQTLHAAMQAAAEHHRLVTSERVLLEQTLHGSIKALIDVLSLTNPVAFGRANRIKQLVSDLAVSFEAKDRWQIDVAAMLSQLGCITLPPEVAEKLYYGQQLSEREKGMVEKLPSITGQLLASIPRMEIVRGILASQSLPGKMQVSSDDAEAALVAKGSQLIRMAIDFDDLVTQGSSSSAAIGKMRGRKDRYDLKIFDQFAAIHDSGAPAEETRDIPLSALRVGMILAHDVWMTNGALLAARGYEVTESFIERSANFAAGTVKEPLCVLVEKSAKQATELAAAL